TRTSCMCISVRSVCSLFFFSSRRRHTRWPRDWSSDVCSSDLAWLDRLGLTHLGLDDRVERLSGGETILVGLAALFLRRPDIMLRSEERRVGKECRSGWSPDH